MPFHEVFHNHGYQLKSVHADEPRAPPPRAPRRAARAAQGLGTGAPDDHSSRTRVVCETTAITLRGRVRDKTRRGEKPRALDLLATSRLARGP